MPKSSMATRRSPRTKPAATCSTINNDAGNAFGNPASMVMECRRATDRSADGDDPRLHWCARKPHLHQRQGRRIAPHGGQRRTTLIRGITFTICTSSRAEAACSIPAGGNRMASAPISIAANIVITPRVVHPADDNDRSRVRFHDPARGLQGMVLFSGADAWGMLVPVLIHGTPAHGDLSGFCHSAWRRTAPHRQPRPACPHRLPASARTPPRC